jgi:putative ABC transport system permease protein
VSVGLLERPLTAPAPETSSGGVPARQAMIRWAWRLFRREWRQQLLILALVVVAVAATVVGAAVAVNTPPPANAGFGSANHMGTFAGNDPRLSTEIATLEQRFGQVDVIENQTLTVPGSVETYELRAQDPNGAFGTPMLSVIAGHYPAGPGQVALTPGLASALNLQVGDTWHHDGAARTVVGIVQNPQSLLDAFALVVPGQVTHPTQATVLFDATVPASSLGPNFSDFATPGSTSGGGALKPDTIVLTLATLGMLLIALVSIGGFTVLAQRRLRAIGMLESIGATDKNVRLVMRANGVIVGAVGALAGFVLGLGLWLAYRPHVEQSVHHLIGAFAVPWVVVLPAMALAVVATTFAAGRPARAIARVPVVSALAGRPAPPKPLHRSAVPGVVVFVIAFLLFGLSGGHARSGGGAPELVLGLVALIVAIILLSPLALTVVGKVGSKVPVAARLAMRDLARYRSRSGSALAAISLGVLIAVIICGAAAARYGNVLDYAGPNLSSNQLVVYTPQAPAGGSAGSQTTVIGPNINGTSSIVPNGSASTGTPASLQSMTQTVHGMAAALGATPVELDATSANLVHNGPGRQFDGQIYLATPALLEAYGINPSSIDPKADILTMRAGLSGTPDMQLQYGAPTGSGGPVQIGADGGPTPCPATSCVANPVIQEVSALPTGTSAPNTVVTEHAVRSLRLESSVSPVGWLLQSSSPFTAVQIDDARQTASAAGMTVESKNDAPSSSEIINWATVFGIALALGVLAMSVGLIRSETARDLRTLTATGASSATRRTITAVTAGTLGFVGAVLGAVAGYIALSGWFRSSELNGGLSALAHVPWFNLFLLVVGMPLAAAALGWLLAGREPSGIATRPTE